MNKIKAITVKYNSGNWSTVPKREILIARPSKIFLFKRSRCLFGPPTNVG